MNPCTGCKAEMKALEDQDLSSFERPTAYVGLKGLETVFESQIYSSFRWPVSSSRTDFFQGPRASTVLEPAAI